MSCVCRYVASTDGTADHLAGQLACTTLSVTADARCPAARELPLPTLLQPNHPARSSCMPRWVPAAAGKANRPAPAEFSWSPAATGLPTPAAGYRKARAAEKERITARCAGHSKTILPQAHPAFSLFSFKQFVPQETSRYRFTNVVMHILIPVSFETNTRTDLQVWGKK